MSRPNEPPPNLEQPEDHEAPPDTKQQTAEPPDENPAPAVSPKPTHSPSEEEDKKSEEGTEGTADKLPESEDSCKKPKQLDVKVATSPSASAAFASAGKYNVGSGPTICQNCQTSTTPLWRRDESGQILCNACGLFLKLHGRPRPISLKTNIIKSRNRARNNNSQAKRKGNQAPIAVSPSFAAISPHLMPHGSPLRPGLANHDLQQIDHLSMSLSPSLVAQGDSHVIGSLPLSHAHSQHALVHHHSQLQHQQNLQRSQSHHPTTPSSIFSHPSTEKDRPSQPHMSKLPHTSSHGFGYSKGPPPMRGGENPQLSSRPPALIASAAGTPNLSATTPQFNAAASPRPLEDHNLTKLPALSSLTALATEAEEQRNKQHAALPPISQSLTNKIGSTDGGSPHILTPQSRPQSRPQSPIVSSTNGSASKAFGQDTQARLSAKGEAMSEQLIPRFADESLDTIPSLRHLMNDRLSGALPSSYAQSPALSSLPQPRTRPNGIASPRLNPDDASVENTNLKTRVSELELVNDLLRSRVTQLEYSEANIRESELILRRRLQEMEDKNKKLMRKLKNLFQEERAESRKHSDVSDDYSSDYQESHPKSKKMKVSDVL